MSESLVHSFAFNQCNHSKERSLLCSRLYSFTHRQRRCSAKHISDQSILASERSCDILIVFFYISICVCGFRRQRPAFHIESGNCSQLNCDFDLEIVVGEQCDNKSGFRQQQKNQIDVFIFLLCVRRTIAVTSARQCELFV